MYLSTEAVLLGNANLTNVDETMPYSPQLRGFYPLSKGTLTLLYMHALLV